MILRKDEGQIPIILLIILTASGMGKVWGAGNYEGVSPELRACQPCHFNPITLPRDLDEYEALHQLGIDYQNFRGSIHYRRGLTTCSDCHKGEFASYPHQVQKRPQCLDCHNNIKSEYLGIESMAKGSVHFEMGITGFDCGSCHSPHTMVPAREMTVEAKNHACKDCHESERNLGELSLASRHNWHPQAVLHLNQIACIACHTRPQGYDLSFRHRILPKAEATSDCYECHGKDTRMAFYVGSFGEQMPAEISEQELVQEYYISGATRKKWLDRGGIALMIVVMAGIIVHGTMRLVIKKEKAR